MRILFLDIASHQGLLACSTEERVLSSQNIDHRVQDSELIFSVERVFKKAKWSYQSLSHIACVIGPGGFTSLRVGVAFANALAWSLKIPITGIHLSDLYAARVSDPLTLTLSRRERGNYFLWLHSTKKHELFVRGFGTYRKKWPEPTHVLWNEIPEHISWCGELLPEHIRPSWKEMLLESIGKVLPQCLQAQTYTNKSVRPWYGREG